jgi:hypothetical protein
MTNFVMLPQSYLGVQQISTIFCGTLPISTSLKSSTPFLWRLIGPFVYVWTRFSAEIICYLNQIFHNPHNFLQSWIAKFYTFFKSDIQLFLVKHHICGNDSEHARQIIFYKMFSNCGIKEAIKEADSSIDT